MNCCNYVFQGIEKIQNIQEYINQLSNIFNIVTAWTYFLNFKKYWFWNLFNWFHNYSGFRSWYVFLEENFLRLKSIWSKYIIFVKIKLILVWRIFNFFEIFGKVYQVTRIENSKASTDKAAIYLYFDIDNCPNFINKHILLVW